MAMESLPRLERPVLPREGLAPVTLSCLARLRDRISSALSLSRQPGHPGKG